MGLFDWFRKKARPASAPVSGARVPSSGREGPGDPGPRHAVSAGPERAMTPEDCARVGTLTVLLSEPPPDEPGALRAWLESLGLEALGVRVEVQPRLTFHLGGDRVRASVGTTSYLHEGVDLREVPPDFEPGRGWICLTWSPPDPATAPPHPFGPEGVLRRLSQLAVVLLRRGPGVVLHRAGERVCERELFIQRLGELEEPSCMPWSAWVVTAVGPEKDCHLSSGMEALGLPDVRVPFERGSTWAARRALEAVSWTCARMVRENREPVDGETWEVPLRARAGAWPVRSEGAVERYVVRRSRELVLERCAEAHPGLMWRTRPGQVQLNAYQALLDDSLASQMPGSPVGEYPSKGGEVPHALVIRSVEGAFALFTNGFGRLPQLGGEEVDAARIELGTFLPAPDFASALLVGNMASFFFSSESSPNALKPGDTVNAPVPERGIAGFLLVRAATLPLQGGPAVTLLALVPLAAREYADVRREGPEFLRRGLGEGAALRAEIARRWRVPQA